MEKRAIKRILFANACSVEFDDEGRILVPQHLMDYAQLKREVAIIGYGEKIEIWAKNLWLGFLRKHRSTFTRYASQVEI